MIADSVVSAPASASAVSRVEPGASLWDAVLALREAAESLPLDSPGRDLLLEAVGECEDLVADAVGSAQESFPGS